MDNIEKLKAENEVGKLKANEDYSRILAQNEILEEKLDTLYKLSKSYFEGNCTQNKNVVAATQVNSESEDPEVEIIETTADISIPATKVAWTKDKLRGFKKKSSVNERLQEIAGTKEVNSERDEANIRSNILNNKNEASDESESPVIHRVKPCYYFSNTGSCRYEERTGLKCKFAHVTSDQQTSSRIPVCQLGINCTRPNCMRSHPRIRSNWSEGSRRPFLEPIQNGATFLNPWQAQYAMNPWMIPQELINVNLQNLQRRN